MLSLGLIFIILIAFTVCVGFVWTWFFKNYDLSGSGEIKSKNIKKEDDKNGLNNFLSLGLADFEQKNYEKALESFNKHPNAKDNEQVLFYINRCNDELCNYDDAEQVSKIIDEYLRIEAIGNTPKDFNITVAKAYAKIGEIEKAEQYTQKALLENAEDVENYKLLGLIQLANKDFVDAKNTISTGLSLQPKNKELHDILSYGLCYQVDNCTLSECREKYHSLIKKRLK